MKINSQFISYDTGTESMLVPTGAAKFSGLVKGNSTFGTIVALLENETTEEKVIEKMCAEYDAPRERIAEDVHTAIEKLRSIGAIDD